MIERDALTGLWLYSHSTGRPGRIAHAAVDPEHVNAHLSSPPARDRGLTGAFDWHAAWARAGEEQDVESDHLYPIVMPITPAGDGVTVFAPETEPSDPGASIGSFFGRHGHLLATLIELPGEPAGVPGWVLYGWWQEHTGHPDIYVNLSYEVPAHADLTDLAGSRGRVLRYPAHVRLYDPHPAPPYTATVGTSVAWYPPPRARSHVALTGYPHLTNLAGPPQGHPARGDIIAVGAHTTRYVAISEVPWAETPSAPAIRSHVGAGFTVLAAVHDGTGTWAAWAVDSEGGGRLTDGHLYAGATYRQFLQPRSLSGTPVTDEPEPVYAVEERLTELTGDGIVAFITRLVFATESHIEHSSSRMAALAAARRRAVRARASYLSRLADFGIEPSEVDLFDPVEVYMRDLWTCQLCHAAVSPKAPWPEPWCATLDHRVPVSSGGGHTRGNTQLAHWTCNMAKGTT